MLLTEIGFEILKTKYSVSPKIDLFVKKLRFLADKYDNLETLDTFKTVVLQGISNIETIDMILPLHLAKKIPLQFSSISIINSSFAPHVVNETPNV